MAATIRTAKGVEPELIKGGKGVFDVRADGEIVYSKHATGRFPDADEVLSSL